ncbi:MAG: hypothetical protein K6D91_05835 [Prevotella sp.]|nr:hypothetical protein [Prevotella sp.]
MIKRVDIVAERYDDGMTCKYVGFNEDGKEAYKGKDLALSDSEANMLVPIIINDLRQLFEKSENVLIKIEYEPI